MGDPHWLSQLVTPVLLSPQLFIFLFLLAGQEWSGGAAGSSLAGLVGRRPLEFPASSAPRRKRAQVPPSYLQWVPFQGQLPADAVSSWNQQAQQLEFVCSTREFHCNTGAYVPQRGPRCFYPHGGVQRSTKDFKLLVNVGGFEALDWVEESFGAVPEEAVEGCPSIDIFVGRNKYGLGKVSKEHRALFVVDPDDGEEIWFKWYQVLVVRKGPADVTIRDVLYNISAAVESIQEVTLAKATLRNEACQKAQEVITLKEDTEVEHDWQMDQRIFSTIRGVLEVSPLTFNGTSWQATNSTSTVPWVGGASSSHYVVHSRVVEQELEALTACEVAMEGQRRDVHVPFRALLSRDFGHGHTHQVTVTGWARSRAVLDVEAGVKQCWRIPGVPPCQG
ncbi:natterin-3-like [Pogoniulus pusillus]|uniref:natterin-3-like n=1 Tax=Pogoniulus pusillus TaxID=488313 RepID=UPI0030B94388